MNYLIGSGYHHKSDWDAEFFEIWKKNTEKYTNNYYVVCTNTPANSEKILLLNNNLGHVGDCIAEKRDDLCGWSHSIITLAMIAYGMGKDLIFKESDCLFFGDVPQKLYEDIGDKGMVFGPQMTSAPYMPCAQSTFLIKHFCIIGFVRSYLYMKSDRFLLPEDKFVELEKQQPEVYGRFSFGVDRQRPLPWSDEVWYAQQWTREELNEAKERGLI